MSEGLKERQVAGGEMCIPHTHTHKIFWSSRRYIPTIVIFGFCREKGLQRDLEEDFLLEKERAYWAVWCGIESFVFESDAECTGRFIIIIIIFSK